jgi:hypothetical protein
LIFLSSIVFFSEVNSHLIIDTDDAYITYRYARNLAEGMGFTYNVGERVLGTTTPLYTILLTGGAVLGADIESISAVLNILFAALVVVLVYLFVVDRNHSQLFGLLGVLLLISQKYFVTYSLQGMETSLYLFLILATILAYGRERYSLAALLASLTFLTRYDGAILAGVLLLDYVLIQRKKLTWKISAAFLVPSLLWVGFSLLYFGSPLPQSMLVKHEHGLISNRWWMLDYVITYEILFLACISAIGVYLSLRRRALNRTIRLLAIWVIFYSLGFTVYKIDLYLWYFAPLTIALAVLPSTGFSEIIRVHQEGANPRGKIAPILITLLVFVPYLLLQFKDVNRSIQAQIEWNTTVGYARIAIAERIRTEEQLEPIIATGGIGHIGYQTNAYIWDLMGLVTKDAYGKSIDWNLNTSDADWLITQVKTGRTSYPQVDGFSLDSVYHENPMPMDFLLYKREGIDALQTGTEVNVAPGFKFTNGIVIQEITLKPSGVEIVLSLETTEVKDYKVFVHVIDPASGEIASILDFDPDPPTSEMQVGENYSSGVVWTTSIAPGAQVEIGLFDAAQDGLPRLQGADGQSAVTLVLPDR